VPPSPPLNGGLQDKNCPVDSFYQKPYLPLDGGDVAESDREGENITA